MANTIGLQVPFITPGTGAHVPHNEAIAVLDTIVSRGVLSSILNAAPSSPSEMDMYIIGPSVGSGDPWTGKSNKIGYFLNGVWRFISPQAGFRVWVTSQNFFMLWTGATWQPMAGTSFVASKSGATSTASTSYVDIDWDTEALEPSLVFEHPSSADDALTKVKYGGLYEITFSSEASSTTAAGQYEFAVGKNGSAVSGSERKFDIALSAFTNVSVRHVVSLVADDVISILAKRVSGTGTLSLTAGRNVFSIRKISP